MIRRALLVPAAVAATALLAACSTFTDNDLAARVGDVELPQSTLEELMVAATPDATPDDPVEVAGDTARTLIGAWTLTRILEGEVAAAGGSITDDDRQAAADDLAANDPGWAQTPEVLQQLQIDRTAAINVWSAIEEPAPTDDELREIYDQGITASGVACTAHILVETRDEADAIVEELAAGADFAELAIERSTDAGSAPDGGVLPCTTAAEFRQSYVEEFVDAALAADVGVPTDPVESTFGYHVILVRPFDDVADEGVAEIYGSTLARFGRASQRADVYVDPRFGAFDPTTGVTPLG